MLVTLVESRSRYNSILLASAGQELFSISQSTTRGDYGVNVRSGLPGLRLRSSIPAAPEVTSYEPAEAAARKECAQALQVWLAQTFGINAAVIVVNSSDDVLCELKAGA